MAAKGNFTKQMEAFTRKCKMRQTAIFRQSVQDLSHDASVPIAQGGNMPVDTGFLRNSIGAASDSMPSTGAQPPETYLLTVQAGDTVYVGWTANYAIYMNFRYQFADLAAQKWDYIVQKVTHQVRKRYP